MPYHNIIKTASQDLKFEETRLFQAVDKYADKKLVLHLFVCLLCVRRCS